MREKGMKKINVALVGYGNIGTGFCANLNENHDLISGRLGLDIHLKHVCDIDLERDRWFKVDPSICSRDYRRVVDDPEVDIVIELVGGTTDAKDIISRAFKKGKHVVTANKALLAEKGREIFRAAREADRIIRFEASVGGGIPCIKGLMEGLASNRIEGIAGIVNGTSNYILTRMTEDRMEFKDALSLAMEKGFAEPNPTFDIDGIDPSHKITILSSIASGKMVDLSDVYVEGICQIERVDVEIAAKLDAVIKPLVIFRNGEDKIHARVHPMMVPRTHKLAFINENYNIIYIKGSYVGITGFSGLGAGSVPTSSAVMADTIDIAKAIETGAETRQYAIPDLDTTAAVANIDDTTNPYCIRLRTSNPSLVRARFDVNSIRVERHENVSEWEVFVTGPVLERRMKAFLSELSSHPTVTSPPSFLRVFNLEM
jgi:homoserine dehydrogenase